ncbi:MAG TPA: transposase, partial [Longimicrobiales bacterium]|nr:transposase [Longimicrobiales bacterium]
MTDSSSASAYASLAAVGRQCRQLGIWPVVAQHVQIKQKVRVHSPLDKLLDCFLNILAGGRGLVEINTRVRPDPALQRAFGRTGCAEQSTISDTLNACTPANVQQLRAALDCLLRRHSQTARHDYAHRWQLFDIDLTGLRAGRQGEGVEKGYFAQHKNARGRQLGRVIASHYDEILCERLYPGKRQLEASLLELVDAAAATLKLRAKQRQNTLLRLDGGGGSDANINALLERQYQVLVKVHNWQRARKLAETVTDWFPDPKVAGRAIGWVSQPHAYAHPTQQIAVRKPKPHGGWTYAVIVSNASDALLAELLHRPVASAANPRERALQIVHAYDQRGGGAETQIKADKQGLGLAQRNKRAFAAQEMLVLLAQLAHNLTIWTRNALATVAPRLAPYGIQRMVRDVYRIPGQLRFDALGHLHIVLSAQHPLSDSVVRGFAQWLPCDDL